MDETKMPQFSELVEKRLDADENSRELWRPIADEFNRGGPDATKAYLDAEAQRLLERVEKLLGQVEGR